MEQKNLWIMCLVWPEKVKKGTLTVLVLFFHRVLASKYLLHADIFLPYSFVFGKTQLCFIREG